MMLLYTKLSYIQYIIEKYRKINLKIVQGQAHGFNFWAPYRAAGNYLCTFTTWPSRTGSSGEVDGPRSRKVLDNGRMGCFPNEIGLCLRYHGKYHGNTMEISNEMTGESMKIMIIPTKPLKKAAQQNNPSIVGFGSEAPPKVTEMHSNKLVHKWQVFTSARTSRTTIKYINRLTNLTICSLKLPMFLGHPGVVRWKNYDHQRPAF